MMSWDVEQSFGIIEGASGRVLAETRRKAGRIAALCDLLDAAGWGVAFKEAVNGPIQVGEQGRDFLNLSGSSWMEKLADWQDFCGMIPSEQVVLSVPGLVVWRTAAPASPENNVAGGLTPREREVMDWISKGKTVPEVAVIIGCSRRTVEKHVANLYKKLGLRDRAALILK